MAAVTIETIWKPKFEFLPHPACNSDLAPSDYYIVVTLSAEVVCLATSPYGGANGFHVPSYETFSTTLQRTSNSAFLRSLYKHLRHWRKW
jgi:hypothetical protein